MTPKKLWLLTALLFSIYVITYISLAASGIHTYSRHLSWTETLILSIGVMLTLSLLIGILIALFPIGQKKFSERLLQLTLPVAISIFTILFGIALIKDLNKKNFQPVEKDNSTSLVSSDYPDQQDRIEKLRSVIQYNSEFTDAEFKLFNVNGFEENDRSTPGASSWNYEFIIKVNPSDVDAWTSGMEKTSADSIVLSGGADLIPKAREMNWKTSSEPEIYSKGKSVTMLVYRKEGIILKRIINY